MIATRESIELAARAIHEVRDSWDSWDELLPLDQGFYRDLARAAITALPDPICSQCQTWTAMTPGVKP